MPEPLADALAGLRGTLLDPDRLVRAVAAGRRRNAQPSARRVELRPVDLRDGRVLQVVTYDERQARTRNERYDGGAGEVVDALLAEPFGNWHVETSDATVQLRVTKRGEAQVHRSGRPPADVSTGRPPVVAQAGRAEPRTHDRVKPRLLDPGDELFGVLGADAGKRRQVDAFLRVLDPVVAKALPAPRPLTMVDLGCGNAYLTFAAHRFLTAARDRDVRTTGVDVKAQARAHNTEVAEKLGVAEQVAFVEGTIAGADVAGADVVLALHACDTATDDALARGVRWDASVLLASPCCHHDIQRQMREHDAPEPYALLTRHGSLRERFADTLTDALRAAILRLLGYRVDVVEFVESDHTPRNLLLRAVRTGAPPLDEQVREYLALIEQWQVRPKLAELLEDRLAPVLARGAE